MQTILDAKKPQPESEFDRIDLSSMETVIATMKKTFDYLSLYIEESDSDLMFIGTIQEFDASAVVLHTFGTMSFQGRAMFMTDLDQITRVSVKGLYEENLMLLQ